ASALSGETTGQTVTLVSEDGHEFVVDSEVALASGTIKSMLSGPGMYEENMENRVAFREVSSHILELVCKYFYYRMRHSSKPNSDCVDEIPEFEIKEEYALELLMAAS